MSEKWYKHSYRRHLLDMHIEAWNEEFLSKFDPEQYFAYLKKAHITSPMIYTHSHVGWCNWNSASGAMHPAWKGVNKVKKLFDLCNEAGMDVVAYYSLMYNNWAYDNHPDWRTIDLNGNPSRIEGNRTGRYGLVCPNNKDYREFLVKQFKELTAEYEFKGVYLDMTFWSGICYCPSCRARYKKETGKEIPEYIDWTDAKWLEFQATRERWMNEFAHFCTDEWYKIKPGVTVEHQSSPNTHPWIYGISSEQAAASDFTGGDLYGGFEQQSLVCKLYYDITADQPFEYQTSRADPALWDHTTTKTPEQLKLHAYLAYAHHGAFFVIDAIDPRGTMNGKVYDVLETVFSETEPYEKFFTGELTADVSLYFSHASKMVFRDSVRRRADLNCWDLSLAKEMYPHIDCVLGAEKALRNARIPFRVNTKKSLAQLGQNKVLVLSDLAFISPEEEEAFVKYVEDGGSLYMSGITPARLVKRLLGITVSGFTAETVTYIRPTEAGQPYFCMYDPKAPMTIFDKQMLAENAGNAGNTVLAEVTLPYTRQDDIVKFASIHSNPPGIDTENPAIVCGKFGKGKVIWSSAPFEQSAQSVHKQVFANLLTSINPAGPQIKSDAPALVEFTVFTDTAKNIVQLHCVNIQEHFPLIPLQGFTVAVRLDKGIAPEKVKLLPDLQDVPFTVKDGYVEFRVESIHIFRMYQIEYA